MALAVPTSIPASILSPALIFWKIYAIKRKEVGNAINHY
jgi:hypothetical protein